MTHPLDNDDDLGLEPQQPCDMSNAELGEAVAVLAEQCRDALAPAEHSLLVEAGYRLRVHARMRDALADRVAEVERLRRELARLRGAA